MSTATSITFTLVVQNDTWDATAAYHLIVLGVPTASGTRGTVDLTIPSSATGSQQTLTRTLTGSDAATYGAGLAPSIAEGGTYGGSASAALTAVGTGQEHYWGLHWDDSFHGGSGKVFSLKVHVEFDDGTSRDYVPTLVEPDPATPSITSIVGTQPVLDASDASYVTWANPYSYYAFYIKAAGIPPLRQHPRGDALGLSGARRAFGNRSQQASIRRAGGFL